LVVRREPPDPQSRMVLDIAAGTRSERLFTDEYRCPIAVEDLASALLELVGEASSYSGMLHVAGSEALSRLELGRLVLAAHGFEGAALPSWTLAESGLRRPSDVRLSSSRAQSILRTRLRPMSEYLGQRHLASGHFASSHLASSHLASRHLAASSDTEA
ncbi:MAG: sugar nucleotide-binding protein, partial [Dehalococcoidia bacterium]